MTNEDRISRLERDLRITKGLLAIVGLGGAAALLVAATLPARDANFGTVTAERINIVEPGGLFRAVLTNAARSPGPMKQARVGAKEGKRNFPIAGLIIYDSEGQEQGGYGTGAVQHGGSMAVSMLDWPGGTGGGFGEAIGTFRRIDPVGKQTAGLVIVDRPPVGEDPGQGVDRRRIKLQTADRDAQVLLADPQGRDRIRMRVDPAGQASIEILDAAGKTTFRAPD